MKNIININDSITIEINKKFGRTIITLNKNGKKEVLSSLKTNDYFWSDAKFDENYIIIYSRGCMVNQIPLKIESAYNIKTDTIIYIAIFFFFDKNSSVLYISSLHKIKKIGTIPANNISFHIVTLNKAFTG